MTEVDNCIVQVLWDQNRTIVALCGTMGRGSIPAIDEAIVLIRNLQLPVEVDLRHVTAIDRFGIVAITKLALAKKNGVTLLYPNPQICFMLRATGLDEHVRIALK